jgi:WhiB family redox-sensing transcriptional regulator
MIRFEITGAPCQSTDPETFFPDATEFAKIAEAKSFCGQCNPDTKLKCLTFALTNNVVYGVFGGLTEDERKRIKRKGQTHQYISVTKEY